MKKDELYPGAQALVRSLLRGDVPGIRPTTPPSTKNTEQVMKAFPGCIQEERPLHQGRHVYVFPHRRKEFRELARQMEFEIPADAELWVNTKYET